MLNVTFLPDSLCRNCSFSPWMWYFQISTFSPTARSVRAYIKMSTRGTREDWINAQALTGCWIYHYFSCFLFEQFLTTKHLNIWNCFVWKGHESSSFGQGHRWKVFTKKTKLNRFNSSPWMDTKTELVKWLIRKWPAHANREVLSRSRGPLILQEGDAHYVFWLLHCIPSLKCSLSSLQMKHTVKHAGLSWGWE